MCILGFLAGTRGARCPPQPHICAFLHSWMGRTGHFALSSRIYVYFWIPGWDARGTLPSAGVFLHSWMGRTGHFALNSRIYLYSWIPGWDARDTYLPFATDRIMSQRHLSWYPCHSCLAFTMCHLASNLSGICHSYLSFILVIHICHSCLSFVSVPRICRSYLWLAFAICN